MKREHIWWLVLVAIVGSAVTIFAVRQIQRAREMAALIGPGACTEAQMLDAIQSFDTTILFAATVMPVFGVIAAAFLALRLRPELKSGRSGTGKRLLIGLVVAVGSVLTFAALSFLLHGHCFRDALAAEGRGGLPAEVAASPIWLGGFFPNFWVAASLQLLLLTLVSFALLSLLARLLVGGIARVRGT